MLREEAEDMDHERALKEMAAFFQNSSAEMRSLLTAALAALEQPGENADQQSALRLSLYRLLRLAWNLGDFSMAADELPLQLVLSSPLALVEELYDEAAALIESTGRKLLLATDEPLPSVALHPYATRRILYQLLSNAMAVTPVGGSIRLSCRRAGTQLLFSVADEGEGIAPEALDAMFAAPFTETPDFMPHGLRLGLPLAKLLAEKQGGRLLVENGDKGACFTLALSAERKADRLQERRMDYTGGVSRALVELSGQLPRDAYKED